MAFQLGGAGPLHPLAMPMKPKMVFVAGNPLKTGAADYFFSYCWRNSKEAFDQRQISTYVGNEWNDPRLIVKRLSSSTNNMSYWLDIERLQSASESLGMVSVC